MPEKTNPGSLQPPSEPVPHDAGHVPITEEFDSAKWTLPPVVPVLGALVGIALIVGVIAMTNRAKPPASGTITKVVAAEQVDNVLVAIHLKFDNVTDKQLWIKNIKSELETAEGTKLTDSAAPSVELERYFQAFPVLAQDRIEPLKEELKIAPKASQAGMTIFAFPVNKAAFDARKSLSVHVQFYDQPMTMVVTQ